MSMRIAQVCADRGIAPGGTKGASLHLRGLAAGLQDLGHEVVTYTQRQAVDHFPAEVSPLEALVTAGPVDVVYERYSLGHLGGLEHARRRGVPFVLEVNAPLVDEALLHRPDTVNRNHRGVEQQLLADADLVIVVSSALERWVRDQRSGPTLAVPNGHEPAWFSGPRPALEYDLAFIGHPKPWHGAQRIPQLLASLHAAGSPATAIVIGGGDRANALIDDARRAGVVESLHVTGALPPEEAAHRLRTARIGLAPYQRIEPFYFCPLKVVDYLAAGLAVVASHVGDIPALVGTAGVLVDPDDDAALCDAVNRLLNNPRDLATRSLDGRRIARDQTWKSVAAQTLTAIQATGVAA